MNTRSICYIITSKFNKYGTKKCGFKSNWNYCNLIQNLCVQVYCYNKFHNWVKTMISSQICTVILGDIGSHSNLGRKNEGCRNR